MPSITQPSDYDFEVTFADLAHSSLRDKAPALLDYLLGFQTIEVNDKQTHAVGVLGFKVGEQMIYVPTFFMNGELKQNCMYVKDQDLFVPLQDNWVTFLLNRRPSRLGDSIPNDLSRLGVSSPDFRALSGQQFQGFGVRSASDKSALVDSMIKVDPNKYAKIPSLVEFLDKTASHEFLLRCMRNNETLRSAVTKIYDVHDLAPKPGTKVAKSVKVKIPSNYVKPTFSILDAPVSDNDFAKSAADKVRILHGSNAVSQFMTDEEKETLFRGGFLFKDAREKTNSLYKSALDGTKLQNPEQSGVHELLVAHNKFEEVTIFLAPQPAHTTKSRVALVIYSDGSFTYRWPQDLWCRPKVNTKSNDSKWFDSLSDVSSVSVGDAVAFVTPKMHATTVLKIVKKNSLSDGIVELVVSAVTGPSGRWHNANPDRPLRAGTPQLDEWRDPFAQDPYPESYPAGSYISDGNEDAETSIETRFGEARIVIISNKVTDIKYSGHTVFIPENAKCVKLQKVMTSRSLANLDPPTLADIDLDLLKHGAQMFSLRRFNKDYYVDEKGPFSKKAVLTAMVKKSGLRGEDSLLALDSVEHGTRRTFFVKLSNVYAPPIPEPQFGMNDYTGYPEQIPLNQDVTALTDVGSNVAPYMGKPEVKQIADAAQTGQKDVFDVAAIGSLVKSIDNDELVNRYLSDIILGMDRVNRILFMYYWNYEKFRDRYGQENLVELEDQLKNVSKGMGDLVLFLKQRNVGDSESLGTLDLPSFAGSQQ